MKAIVTKILPVTDTKPTRIKVSAEGVSHKVCSRDLIENELLAAGLPVNDRSIHHAAAVKFCGLHGWGTSLVSGGLPNGDWCHCFPDQTWVGFDKLGAEKPPVKTYTVVAVSSNANSFGYKSVLCLADDGDGLEFLVQAYGTDNVPVRGDVVRKDESRWYSPCTRTLEKITPEQAHKVLADVRKSKS